MSRTSTHVIGANSLATATQDQVEAALAYINRRLMLDVELIHCRSLCAGFRATVTYYAEGIGNTKLGELECLSVTAAPSLATWGIVSCDPLLRRALKLQGVVFDKAPFKVIDPSDGHQHGEGFTTLQEAITWARGVINVFEIRYKDKTVASVDQFAERGV